MRSLLSTADSLPENGAAILNYDNEHIRNRAVSVPAVTYGNAVLSRVPIVSCETIPIPDPCPKLPNRHYETRCLIKVRLENGLTILVSHFGLNEDEQRNAVDTVLLHLEETNCILMGDFNMTPDNPTLAPIFAKMKDTSSFTSLSPFTKSNVLLRPVRYLPER